MLGVTKERTTLGFVDLHAQVPEQYADKIKAAFESVLAVLAGITSEDDNEVVIWQHNSAPGELLRGARNREGLSQQELADKIGVKRPNISDMERGRRTITPDMAKKLGEALNTSPSNFTE